uniref:Uncharacterized protein n=1 Tax=Gopherus agassizii TaxID=38772 RepID=A0A452I7G4_9SAUR
MSGSFFRSALKKRLLTLSSSWSSSRCISLWQCLYGPHIPGLSQRMSRLGLRVQPELCDIR